MNSKPWPTLLVVAAASFGCEPMPPPAAPESTPASLPASPLPAPAEPTSATPSPEWVVDFRDDFDAFEPDHWQDQLLWVNDEDQCYVRDGANGTREVKGGLLTLRVVDLGKPVPCDNVDKHGKQHPPTPYVAGRITTKNRKEFVGGRWSARLRLVGSGTPGMFPAWWLLGGRNDEPPVQEPNETVCWPLEGSGEIDIFEHFGGGGPDHFVARRIVSLGACDKGDWKSRQHIADAPLDAFHEYSVEWDEGDLVYRLDGAEIYRNEDEGKFYPEPMFAILNYAKVSKDPMPSREWAMEVDWVRHESR